MTRTLQQRLLLIAALAATFPLCACMGSPRETVRGPVQPVSPLILGVN